MHVGWIFGVECEGVGENITWEMGNDTQEEYV